MNDSELDAILQTWSPPRVPVSLRKRVRAALPPPPARKGKWIVTAVLAAAVFFVIVTRAFPQNSQRPPAPWTVDSEFIRYAGDGSSAIEMVGTSYNLDGNEVMWSRSMPGNVFKTALGQAIDLVLPIHNRIVPRLMLSAEQLERRKRALASSVGFITGCNGGCLVLDHFYFRKAAPGP